jgi:hypothetical protein
MRFLIFNKKSWKRIDRILEVFKYNFYFKNLLFFYLKHNYLNFIFVKILLFNYIKIIFFFLNY